MNWLKKIRERAGMTQKDVAEAISISQPAYANIENGRRTPSVETAQLLGKLLHFSWTEFFEKSDHAV